MPERLKDTSPESGALPRRSGLPKYFVNHPRVKAPMMISCSTLRERVSARLGRDDVRTVTVLFVNLGAVGSDFPTLVLPLGDRR